MFDDPPARLILAEVRDALVAGLAPGFAQKVAANALAIALREQATPFPPEQGADEVADLIRNTLAKIAVDQPAYPGFRALRDSLRG